MEFYSRLTILCKADTRISAENIFSNQQEATYNAKPIYEYIVESLTDSGAS